MSHSNELKKIRKQLGLTQKDVSTNNLSPNLLSMIETDQVELTPQKALMLYKKYTEVALIKGIDITLDFDLLLSQSTEYAILKKAFNICSKLNVNLQNNQNVSLLELEEYVSFAHSHEIGLFKYFIYTKSAELLIEDSEPLKERWLTEALDILKWYSFKDIHFLYAKTLKLLTKVCFNYRGFEKLTAYTLFLIEQLIENHIQVDSDLYYNVSLFYSNQKKYTDAYKYFIQYEEKATLLSMTEKFDNLILKSVILNQIHQVNEAFKLYEIGLKWLDGLHEETFLTYKALILSNIIYESIVHNFNPYLSKLTFYLNELEELVKSTSLLQVQKRSVYTNLAIGCSKVKSTDKSQNYLKKAFEASVSSDEKFIIIHDYLSTCEINDLDMNLIDEILKIDLKALSITNREHFLLILLEIALKTEHEYARFMLTKYINQLKEKH